ncbi:hypothetical protein [Actinopolymorpha alba]|uniref:hypothetical protein n=1 Tax=Actinopolymorpha alba TaxID=533267 RepID=UPI0003768941|nr:hypothetical protein [Actinopolymorpha alba]
MRRTGALVLAVGLGLAGLTACSSSDKAYCDKVRAVGEEALAGNASATDPTKLSQVSTDYREIADVAPSDVKEHWKVLATAMEDLGDLLKDPANMDASKAQETSSKMQESLKAVTDDVKERCS